jgi:hypothetical protein
VGGSKTGEGFVQVAYFVEDVVAAAEFWAREHGAGPFLVLENIPLQNVVYRGKPGELDHSSAYGQFGALMLELVQQNNDGPSAFRDVYPPGQFGLHHMARFAPDLEASLEKFSGLGHATAMTALAGDLAFAFVDTQSSLGHMLELYQDCEAIRGFYQLVAAAAETRDGKDVFFELPGGT